MPSQDATPTGYTKIGWRAAVLPTYISDPVKGFAQYFQPNKRELLPIYSDIIQSNYNLTQDYGY
jgi:hypothetical protein